MLNEEEIHVMEHALGIEHAWDTHGYHYKRHGKQYIKSYRNYYLTTNNDKNWSKLLENGFASSFISPYDKDYIYFQVTDEGIAKLEKQQNYIVKFID